MKSKTKHIFAKLTLPLALLCPIVTFYLFESYTHNPFETMKPHIQLMNLVLFEFSALFLFLIFRRLNIALMLQTVVSAIWGLANYFIISFRSAPIMPWDIYALKTAASVADNYEYMVNRTVVIVTLLVIGLLILEFFIRLNCTKKIVVNLCLLVATLLFFCGFSYMLHQEENMAKLKLYDKLFTPTVMCRKNGTAVTFIMELKYLSVEKPSDYNKQEAGELLSSYTKNAEEITADATPNIIVIMNEAFSDPAVLGDFETNADYMPFVHELMAGAENTQSGSLYVSILGGNTPNTEFEFLTGNTLSFLPQGSIPYQQYIKAPLPNLCSYLKEYGYMSAAMHPYYSTGWSRNIVYPYFGFDDISFIDDFENAKYVRKYVSDESAFDKIISTYETKEDGKPLFLFQVTMQNHSSYTDSFPNFTPDIHVTSSDSPVLDHYLSLMHLSDEAFENLVHYFEDAEEDTILVMFGDHQPTDSVVRAISRTDDADVADRYEVPVIIWANFDIEERTDINTSANYLAVDVLKAAGLPVNGYYSFLSELQAEYPVVTPIEVRKSDGTITSVKDEKEALKTYQTLQYHQLMEH